MLEIISLIAGIISIILAVVSIVASIRMNKKTERLLESIKEIALQNKESIGFAEEIMENI